MHFSVSIRVLDSFPSIFVRPHLHGSIGIMAGLLVNSTWIKRFLSTSGGADGTTNGVNPSLTGQFYAFSSLWTRELYNKSLIRYHCCLSSDCRSSVCAILWGTSGKNRTETMCSSRRISLPYYCHCAMSGSEPGRFCGWKGCAGACSGRAVHDSTNNSN